MQYGSIGWSVGATLGYAQAVPDKRVIACIESCRFFVKLDKNDKGKTNAALPMRTKANNTEVTTTDVPGLSLTNLHFSLSKSSIPT